MNRTELAAELRKGLDAAGVLLEAGERERLVGTLLRAADMYGAALIEEHARSPRVQRRAVSQVAERLA